MSNEQYSIFYKEVEKLYNSEQATEHSYRSALAQFIQSFSKKINVINEPKRIACGAPDLNVNKSNIPLGHIEAKDIGINLDAIERDANLKNPRTANGRQFKRYLEGLGNLILTDCLEFRWYVEGEKRNSVVLAEFDNRGKLKIDKDNFQLCNDIIDLFLKEQAPTISSPKELASRMAATARFIRDLIEKAYGLENSEGYFHGQLDSFKEVLIHNLEPDQFADMYAQTICYGLFTARYNYTEKGRFTRTIAAEKLPKTNPFLRRLFNHIGGIELTDEVAWIVDDLAELLNRADIAGIMADFNKRTKREDPVVHFYETFLTSYDPKLRETRGVYYTPEPVVSYIVRSIDHILKKDFGIKDGLADKTKIKDKDGNEIHRVLILDPAVGTGTFLHNVIDHIHESFKGDEGMWSGYVAEHLLPRLFGFELLMAPYAVAHMKLAMQLKESGYKFDKDERLNIFLTNTLEEAFDVESKIPFMRWITDEADEAGKVKKEYPVMVILGNPPYSGHSVNNGDWIRNLLRGKDISTGEATENYFEVDGKPLGERNPKWLNDDYVKFIRFAQHRIDKTGYGILGFISNHGYLDNPTFRGMRQSLMSSFDDIYILDLHGNSKKKEVCPNGSKDQNVFDIQQGVAIGLFVKQADSKNKPAKVHHADLWGVREVKKNEKVTGGKYGWLGSKNLKSTKWKLPTVDKPFYLFPYRGMNLREEYNKYYSIKETLLINSVGITTSRDYFVIHMDSENIKAKISDFRNLGYTDDEIRQKYFKKQSSKYLRGDTREWQLNKARLLVKKDKEWDSRIVPILNRPFDVQNIYYVDWMIDWPRKEVMSQLNNKDNLSICSTRSIDIQLGWCHVLCSKNMIQHHTVSMKEVNYCFPLYLYPKEGELQLDEPSSAPGGRKPNLDPKFIEELSAKIKLKFIPDGKGDLKKSFGPEDIFNYIYAVFHAPTYRTRYAEFLKIDFPRLPLTSSKPLFRKLCTAGQELVTLHLMEADIESKVKYPVAGDNEVGKVRFAEVNPTVNGGAPQYAVAGKVWINDTQYFDNVAQDIWEFQIGGYQVCNKWLKDRKGRKLSFDDLEHYKYIVTALGNTIKLMNQIDAVIEKNGGWPIK